MKVYKQIRKELEKYNKTILEKDEVIVLTKTDVVTDLAKNDVASSKKIEKTRKEFEKLGKPIFVLSLYDDASLKNLMDGLVKMLRKG